MKNAKKKKEKSYSNEQAELFGKRLKEIRNKRGLSQTVLSFKAEIHQSQLSLCESQRRHIIPSVGKIIRLCKTLNVASDYLLGLSNKP